MITVILGTGVVATGMDCASGQTLNCIWGGISTALGGLGFGVRIGGQIARWSDEVIELNAIGAEVLARSGATSQTVGGVSSYVAGSLGW